MNVVYYFLGLIFLVLIQVVVLPLNFAFAATFGIRIFNDKVSIFVWLIVLTIVFSLFSNQNLGLVMVAFGSSFLVLEFLATVLPRNNLVRWGLVLFSLVVCEFSFVVFVTLLK